MIDMVRWLCQPERRTVAKGGAQRGGVAPPAFDPSYKATPHLAPTDGGLYLGHPPVGSERVEDPSKSGRVDTIVNGAVAPPMIPVCPRSLPDVASVGYEHAAFTARAYDLVLAERECCRIAKGPHRSSLVRSPVRLGAIFDDDQLLLAGEIDNRVQIAGPATEMDRDDRFRARRQNGLDRVRRDSLAYGVDVGEDWNRAAHNSGTCRRDESSRGNNDFISRTDAAGIQRQLESNRSVGNTEPIVNLAVGGELFFERSAFLSRPIVHLPRA